ncbi:hypothetical protein OPV22_030829 [Ensete ventricosum]|uniref:Uncharacterized protein n=1 Tax=Ensete ventricosum TaxID=4639 RepID=A0AAV8PNB2_ENSVE|nr:hypothetical protein OPV22_030829 [Ensete ventricosum]
MVIHKPHPMGSMYHFPSDGLLDLSKGILYELDLDICEALQPLTVAIRHLFETTPGLTTRSLLNPENFLSTGDQPMDCWPHQKIFKIDNHFHISHQRQTSKIILILEVQEQRLEWCLLTSATSKPTCCLFLCCPSMSDSNISSEVVAVSLGHSGFLFPAKAS